MLQVVAVVCNNMHIDYIYIFIHAIVMVNKVHASIAESEVAQSQGKI